MRSFIIAGATLAILVAGLGSGWTDGTLASDTSDVVTAGQTGTCTDGPCRMSLMISDPDPANVCDGQKCTLGVGQDFRLTVHLVSVPAVGYILAQSWVDFGTDLSYSPATNPIDEMFWPDCDPVVMFRQDEITHVNHACLTGVILPSPVSMYLGPFVEISLKCPAVGSSHEIRLLAAGGPPANTNGALFVEAQGIQIVPEVVNLTVNCVAGVPIVPTSTARPTSTTTQTPPGSQTPGPGATNTPTPNVTGTAAPGATLTPDDVASPTPTPDATGPATTPSPTPTLNQNGTPLPTFTRTPASRQAGDASCDGTVDPLDAALILQFAAGLTLALPCPSAADASGDGIVDPLDAVLILQFSAGLIDALPV